MEQITDAYEQSDLSGRQKLVLRYTDAFLKTPGEVDASLREAMLIHFSSEEIVELTAAIALFMGFSKIAVSLGQVPESMPVTVMPTPDR